MDELRNSGHIFKTTRTRLSKNVSHVINGHVTSWIQRFVKWPGRYTHCKLLLSPGVLDGVKRYIDFCFCASSLSHSVMRYQPVALPMRYMLRWRTFVFITVFFNRVSIDATNIACLSQLSKTGILSFLWRVRSYCCCSVPTVAEFQSIQWSLSIPVFYIPVSGYTGQISSAQTVA